MGRLIPLFVLALPFAEIATFILVGQQLGVLATLALIILSALAGLALLRWQGISVLAQSRTMMARGEAPAQQIAEGMMLALAGVLLIIPGFLTDLVAFALLIPPLRQTLYRLVTRSMVIVTDYGPGATAPHGPRTIELGHESYRDDQRNP